METMTRDEQLEQLLKRAKIVATEAHRGQTRWDKTPYIEHPKAIAEALANADWPLPFQIVAILHDVVEDNPLFTLDTLAVDFPPEVVAAVDALTHRKEEPYLWYILRARKNIIARVVKQYDIEHNLASLDTAKNKQRADKYRAALWILRHECK